MHASIIKMFNISTAGVVIYDITGLMENLGIFLLINIIVVVDGSLQLVNISET